MKKRLLGLLTAAAMLLSAMPVFAGGEIPSGDDLIWFNDGTNVSEFSGGVSGASVDSGAIKMTLTYEGTADTNLQIVKNVAASSDENYTGILSFKIKAGQTDKHFWIQIGDGVSKTDFPSLALTAAGKIAYSAEGAWLSDKNAFTSKVSTSYTQGEWYDIDMVFNKKTATIDYYVNGVQIGSSSVPSNKLDMTTSSIDFKPSINVAASASALSTPGTANFWLDDITWTTGSDNSFYAFADSDEYTVENPTIGLKFTEQVSNTALASGIKVYNVQSGAAVAATAAFDGNRDLKINVNEKLTAAEEYRIAMPALTSVTGKTIYNDNVYFMSENVGETVVNADETFDSFTQQTLDYYNTVSGNSYYYPNGWYLGFRWASQTKALIEPVEESGRGKVMRFGKSASGEQATSSIYYPMPEKINKGVTHISFDIKPEAYKVADSSNFAGLNTLFTLYPETLTAAQRDYTDGTGNTTCQINQKTSQIPLVGIVGNRLAFTIKNIFNVDGDKRWGALSSWVDNQDKSITDPDKNTWYTVSVDIDWSAKKISYNLNNQVTYESTTLLDELGLANGFGGIGFYSDYNAVNPCSLIDNLKIETVMPASGKSTTTIFSDDFSNYTAGTSKTNGEFYIPNDWATSHIWETQPSVTLKPNTMTQYDGTEGTAVKIAKSGPFGATNDGGSVSLYRGFGQKINEGIVTVEYDINAASALGSSDMDGKALHQFVFDVYPNALTAEQTAFDNATNKVGNSSLIKYINGIQGGAMFVAKDTGTLTDGSLYINADYRDWGFSKNSWHHIKTTFDFEAGTIQTNIDSADKGSAYQLSTFGLSDGISGIGFNQAWNAQNTDIYLDNVTVKHTVDRGGVKVSNVRFVDGKGQKSGVSDSVSTLTEKIEIAFSSEVDETALTNGATLSDKSGNAIVLTNGGFNAETNMYTAVLDDLMQKDTEYTLTVTGAASDDYSVSFKTAATGALDVSNHTSTARLRQATQ